MIRFLLNLLARLFFGTHWRLPEFLVRPARLLYEKALVLSQVFLGRSGVGKTWTLVAEVLELIKAHPEQAFIIFDWSGGLITILLLMILSDPKRDELLRRLVYDPMGGRTIKGQPYIMPVPEFSEAYDPEKPWLERVEDQADRVQRVFEALNEELIKRNPTMGGRPIKSLLANVLLLANAITNEKGESWQITEATRLLNKETRETARKLFGHKVKKANDYFTYNFTGDNKLDQDMGNALADVLDIIKSKRVRARVGYPFPGWNINEAEQKGQIVMCDGSGLTNNHNQKDYLFLQLLFLFVDALNKRPASRPGYQPINLVIDEGYTFTEIPSVARMLSHFPSEYRSRKLQFFFVIQSPKQLPGEENGKKGLEDMFYSFSNIVVFSLLDFDDCMSVVKNFFPFDPQMVKVPSQREGQHDIMENRDEQLAVRAYQLQHLAQRECYVRRFIDEARMDKIIHVGRTREVRITATDEDVENLKDRLMLERGVLLSEAEKIIGQRTISVQQKPSKPRKPNDT
jgi:hypothetical protein